MIGCFRLCVVRVHTLVHFAAMMRFSVFVMLVTLATASTCRAECDVVPFSWDEHFVFHASTEATRTTGAMPQLVRDGGNAMAVCQPQIIGNGYAVTNCDIYGLFGYTIALVWVTAELADGVIVPLEGGRAYNICRNSFVAGASVSFHGELQICVFILAVILLGSFAVVVVYGLVLCFCCCFAHLCRRRTQQPIQRRTLSTQEDGSSPRSIEMSPRSALHVSDDDDTAPLLTSADTDV